MKSPVVVALSGRGRSLENFLRQDNVAYQLVGVVSSNQAAPGLGIAKANGLATYVYEGLQTWMSQWPNAWICLAGFLQRWPNLNGFKARTLNIHPALLPEFGGKGMYGLRVHEAVLSSGRQESGATVHFVSDEYDSGAIVSRIRVRIVAEDNPLTLAQRVFEAECVLYPRTLNELIIDMDGFLEKGVKDYGLLETGQYSAASSEAPR